MFKLLLVASRLISPITAEQRAGSNSSHLCCHICTTSVISHGVNTHALAFRAHSMAPPPFTWSQSILELT